MRVRGALGEPPRQEGEDESDDPEGWVSERAEIIRRFSESPHAGEAPDLGWIDRTLEYGAEYEGVPFAAFDARVLREVLYGLFPRKVSCEATAAREVVHSLRAFWTFARDVLAHPHAAACLAELGDETIPRLARKLEDPSNFGMAKSFVMMGRRQGFRVDSEEGLREWSDAFDPGRASSGGFRAQPARKSEENRRKKKLRKLKKQAQRRNRR